MRPIFIAGPPRSGTSLTARLLAEHGVWTGECILADSHNERGYYENVAMVDIVKNILKKNGSYARADAQPPARFTYLPDIRAEFLKIVKTTGPWLFKDSKLLLLYNIFIGAFPEALWVLTRRNIEANIASLLNHKVWARRYRDDEEKQTNLGIMIRDLMLHQFDLTIKTSNYIWVNPEDFVRGDREAVQIFIETCGLTFNQKACMRAIEPELWHHG